MTFREYIAVLQASQTKAGTERLVDAATGKEILSIEVVHGPRDGTVAIVTNTNAGGAG